MEVMEGIEIPNNEMELGRVADKIETIKIKVKQHETLKVITIKEYHILYDELVRTLFHLADLSIPLFDIQDKLEEQYFRMYSHSPQLAGELFENEYHKIHKPYNLYKNRCFSLIEILDALYRKIHKKNVQTFLGDK